MALASVALHGFVAALTAALLLTALLALTWARIVRASRSAPVPQADAIVVFGAAARPDGPSPELASRLEHAAALFDAGRAPRILCSGGLTGPISEARTMRAALLERGVPAEAILVHEHGSSTRRTVAAARGTPGQGWRSTVLVSSPYHLHRIAGEARRQGVDHSLSAPPESPITRRFSTRAAQTAREVAAVWWYALSATLDDPEELPAERIYALEDLASAY